MLVAFSCEKHLLSQQLDVAELVETKVLKKRKEDANQLHRSNGATMIPSLPWSLSKASAKTTTHHDGEGMRTKRRTAVLRLRTLTHRHTAEEQLISRMIAFVQEPNIDAVAGEWVLARFSGAAGAQWFLCALELGAASQQGGNGLCGRRVACDAHRLC